MLDGFNTPHPLEADMENLKDITLHGDCRSGDTCIITFKTGEISAAMAKMGVAMKMAISPDTPHIADLLEDGCTMGIKSLARYRNQYAEASGQAKRITGELIDLECEMARELLAFL